MAACKEWAFNLCRAVINTWTAILEEGDVKSGNTNNDEIKIDDVKTDYLPCPMDYLTHWPAVYDDGLLYL